VREELDKKKRKDEQHRGETRKKERERERERMDHVRIHKQIILNANERA